MYGALLTIAIQRWGEAGKVVRWRVWVRRSTNTAARAGFSAVDGRGECGGRQGSDEEDSGMHDEDVRVVGWSGGGELEYSLIDVR